MNLEQVLKTDFVKALTRRISEDHLIVLKRPASFMIKAKEEDERDIKRLIVLPPRGHTSNQINQTNCFQGVEKATIQFRGAVRPDKKAFSKVKDALLQVSFDRSARVSEIDRPYLEIDLDNPDPELKQTLHTSHNAPFHVVKPNGEGFHHALINASDDWLVLELHKVMGPQREPNMEWALSAAQAEHADTLRNVHDEIIRIGDKLFDARPDLVQKVFDMPIDISIPALCEMHFIRDTGEHETCTAFGMVLKIAKKNPQAVLDELHKAKKEEHIPEYFAKQLIAKIERKYGGDDSEPQALRYG
ncbi:MAG: hypothetical protein GC137_02820 [Alphaproteobacteria bacterium]|nr:hypothetical protein [Alphaproteobacteria bacterium]